MSDVERLDAIIIGTGQAGKPLAGALAGAGRRTAIIERDRVGGTCVEGSRRGLEEHETLELIMGEARFTGEREVEMTRLEGGTRRLRADHVFINVGVRNRVPALPGWDSVPFLDSTSIMELASVPEHLIVLGGGFIGLEFGQMFRRFGSEVTIIERGRLLSREDIDISEGLKEVLEGDGLRARSAQRTRSS